MYQRILVPVDGSATSLRGLDEAIRLARLTQGTLRLLHVVDELSCAIGMDAYTTGTGDWLGMLRESGARVLQQAGERAKAGGVPFETRLADEFSGRLQAVVADEVARWNADLIVIGTHGRRGIGRMFMGSDAEQILRAAPVPVLLVRDAPEAPKADASRPASAATDTPSAALAID